MEKNGEKKQRSRKFIVVWIAAFLLFVGIIAGVICSMNDMNTNWLSIVLSILASVFPTYLGANAYQKGKELNGKTN